MTTDRIETDSLGEVRVPASAFYGAQTQRALENFPVSGRPMPREFIRAMGIVKLAAVEANMVLGLLSETLGKAIRQAAAEVVEGGLDPDFVVDVYQTGSGTSSNMNANEVIANRAIQILGGKMGSKSPVHPNDHVNMSQSSNDVIPTAIHVAALEGTEKHLLPSLRNLLGALEAKALELDDVLKIGRTHLQDAVPMRLGQEFGGYARQVAQAIRRVESLRPSLRELALGGTAIGTGINAHPRFAPLAIDGIARFTELPFVQAPNLFEALGARDAVVEASGQLKTLAAGLMKIANDLRWMNSGPRCGIGEIALPSLQPGSSIMPGKVNPVVPESVMMVCATVMGNDVAINIGGQHGNLELNTMMPMMADRLLESIRLLANGTRLLADRCIAGIRAHRERAASLIEGSLALVTALVPAIGYDRAARLAQEAHCSGRTIRELARERKLLPEEELDRLLDPSRLTGGGPIRE
jgi:fumarate hydratase class II